MSVRSKCLILVGLLTGGPCWGKPILQGSQGNYVVTEFVNTTPLRAWNILTNFTNQAEWAPDISKANVLKRSGNMLELQQTYKAGYTFGLPIRARLKVHTRPLYGFSYKLIQGDQLNTLQGTWTITPVSGGVQLKHQIQVDPKVPSPFRYFYYEQQEENLRKWMTILKSRMELYLTND